MAADYEMPHLRVVATRSAGQRRSPGAHTLKLLAVPIVILIVVSNVGDALAPKLVDTRPLLLLAMNPRNRNLILVTNQLDAVSYYLVGTLRLLLSDPLFFLIGYWYGDTALEWMERRTKSVGRVMRQWEGVFGKAAYPIVFLAPNNWVCLFAGTAGMGVGGFFAVNIAGTVTRLYLIRRLGEQFEAPIDDVLGFIAEYRTPLLVISVVLFSVWMFTELRSGHEELDSLTEVVEEVEEQRTEDPDPR